jgi:hypothetical protein
MIVYVMCSTACLYQLQCTSKSRTFDCLLLLVSICLLTVSTLPWFLGFDIAYRKVKHGSSHHAARLLPTKHFCKMLFMISDNIATMHAGRADTTASSSRLG